MPKDWKKDEIPHCEVASVEIPKNRGEAVIFHVTPRGWREFLRQRREMAAEERRIAAARRRGEYGIPIDWILNPPMFCSWH